MSSVNGTGGTASNEDLLREVERLKRQLGELSNLDGSGGVEHAALEKSGYLFKWQDRSIGWGGTKWGLRFVRLEHGQLSYYKSHEEKSPRYVLTLKNCAVRDEGSKANPRHNRRASNRSAPEPAKCAGTSTPETYHEEGSHFHVFSVYHLHVKGGSRRGLKEEEDDIIPLLRFSTQSLAEKSQWLELISQACAYCDSPEFVAAQQQQHQRTTQQHQHPSRDRRGKLPKLIFETPQPPLPRLPSGHVGLNKMAQSFRSRTAAKDAARSNKISYPPSKPMHRQASPSYLSPEGRDQDYRGLFNLLLIILLVSNVRLLLDTVAKHGFIWDELVALKGFYEAPLNDFPFVSGLLTVQAFVMGAYLIEKLLSKGWISNQFGMLFHFINTNASLGVVMAIVWRLIDHPVVGALLIMQATITWLKLISYAHANYDYRATSLDKHQATLALVKDLDKKGMALSYPENVTLKDIYYFWLAPTLTYQMAFPRTPFVRWTRVVAYALHLFASATLMAFLAAQVIAPSLDNLVKHLETHGGEVQVHVIGNYLLNLSLTSTYIWLLMFYAFFHCFMNLTAELLRFGDRGEFLKFSTVLPGRDGIFIVVTLINNNLFFQTKSSIEIGGMQARSRHIGDCGTCQCTIGSFVTCTSRQ